MKDKYFDRLSNRDAKDGSYCKKYASYNGGNASYNGGDASYNGGDASYNGEIGACISGYVR